MILAKVQVTYLEKILEDLVLGPYKGGPYKMILPVVRKHQL